MTLFRNAFILFVAATLTGPVFAGASGYWVAPPEYNAHYCPSATTVEPGGTVTLNARAESCTGGKPAEDLDTYKDLNGNEITPPGGPDERRDSLQIEWTITGPDSYGDFGYDTSWLWTAPCTPGTYTVKWRLSDGRLDGDPRRDGPRFTILGTITVTALPEVSITIPPGPGEYVNGVARIKAYASSPDGVSQVSVYIDAVDGNHFKGYMTFQPEGHYLFYWDTTYTTQGTHTIYVVAANSHSYTATDSLEVYAHPLLKVDEIAFEQDHVLYDRVSDQLVSRPQWKLLDTGATIDKPIAYTRNSQMLIRPKLTTTNVSASVYLRYVATLYWDDNTEYIAEKTASGVAFPYNELLYYPTARGTVKQYGASQSIDMFMRKYQDSDWCPTGSTASVHSQIYHTLQYPSSPWGANQNVWTEVLHEACNWANGQSTATGVLTEITKGLHSRTSGRYQYNGGGDSFSNGTMQNQVLFLNCLFNSQQRQGDCRDFANYLCLLANSVGINLQARRSTPPGGFRTKEFYPAGRSGSLERTFGYHQYGLLNQVYDAAIRFLPGGDPPVNMVEEDGSDSDYETALIDSYVLGGNQWQTETPQLPQIAKDWCPTIGNGFWYPIVSFTSARVDWTTNVPASSRIHWDTMSHPTNDSSAYANHSIEYAPFPLSKEHRMIIEGLEPGTRYYFRVQNGCAVSPEVSFMTIPEA